MKLRIPRRIKMESSEEEYSEDSEQSANLQNNIINSEDNNKGSMFVSSDPTYSGFSVITGGPPSLHTTTLTPTTLRNIEQTYQDFNNDVSQSAPYQAGFVPPAPIGPDQYILPSYPTQQAIIPSFLTEEANNSIESLETSSMSAMSDNSWHTPPHDESTHSSNNIDNNSNKGRPRSNFTSSSNNQKSSSTRRNAGGRKPNKPSNLTPEEEEKRRVRRERNKQAAARCRRRREDFTHDLQSQVDSLEERKKQLTTEVQQMSQMRDELCELIEDHKRTKECIISDRKSPVDIKPKVSVSAKVLATAVATTTSFIANTIQRPSNFVTSFSNINNNNNNNNNIANANNRLSLKIKAEPIEQEYEDEPPSKKRCEMLSGQEYDITTPTTPYMPQLNTPTFIGGKNISKPCRPSSLNVPPSLKPSEALAKKNVTEIAGVNVVTPSSGMFNFESLMEGGTGLTPIQSNPLVPCSTQNRNPLEMLNTPTSNEPSKLVSL